MGTKQYITEDTLGYIFVKSKDATEATAMLNEIIELIIEDENKTQQKRDEAQDKRAITEFGKRISEPFFSFLKKERYIEKTSPIKAWRYLCGLTEEMPPNKIVWRGTEVQLYTLAEGFFRSPYYFSGKKMTHKKIYELFVNPNGRSYNAKSIKSAFSQANRKRDGKLLKEKWLEIMEGFDY